MDGTGTPLVVNGTFTANTSTVHYIGVTAATNITTIAYHHLQLSSTATTTYSLTGHLTGADAITGNLTVGNNARLDTTSSNDYNLSVVGDFVQSSTSSEVEANESSITVEGDFSADGSADSSNASSGYNNASLTLTGTGELSFSNLLYSWLNGFGTLTVGQSGNTTTLNNNVGVDLLVVGSGELTSTYYLYLFGLSPLSFHTDSNVSVGELRFFRSTGVQSLPSLDNGYDSIVRLTHRDNTVTQSGSVVINAGYDLIVDSETFVDRVSTYNTAGHSLTVGGDIIVGGPNGDEVLKTFNATNSTVTVGGNFDVKFSGDTQAVAIMTGSTLILNGSTDQTVEMNGSTFNNLVINNTGASGSDDIIINSALDINGTLTLTNGHLDISTNDPAVNTASHVTVSSDGSIDVTSRTVDWTFDGTSVLTDSSTGQDFEDVILNGTSLTLGSDLKLQTLSNNAGTLNLGSLNYVLEIEGTGTPLSSIGTFTAGTSTVKYTGTTTATNIATVPYHHLQLSPTGATTYTLMGDNTLTGNLTVDSNATLEATSVNSYNLNAVDVTINGTYNAQGSTIGVTGNLSNAGTFNKGTSTIDLTDTGTISVTNGNFWNKEFYNVNAAAAMKTTTLVTHIAIVNVLTLGSGVITGAYQMLLKKNNGIPLVTNGATISLASIKYQGETGEIITVAGTTYNSRVLLGGNYSPGANNYVLGGNIVATDLEIYGHLAGYTAILDTSNSNYSITLSNDLDVGGNAGTSYGQLKLNDSVVDVAGSVVIDGSDASGINSIDADTASINVAGNWTNNDTFTAGTSTVDFDGVNQTITGDTQFYNLSKTETVARTLTFAANSTQTIMNGGTVTLTGASGQWLTLNCLGCTSGVNHWNLNINSGAFKSIDYVNVSDADARGSDASHTPINPTNYSDGGSTISWFGGAVITVMKMSSVISDSVNGVSNPKRIPGAVIEYTVVPINSGNASPDVNTVVITDIIDAATVAFDTTNGVSFTDGATSSGLVMGTLTYSSTPAPGPYVYDYVPNTGYDGAVTSIRVTTTGTFNYGGTPNPDFTLRYRLMIK